MNHVSSDRKVAFVSRSGWYALFYPVGWVVQETDESVAICDPEHGVGATHLSAYQAAGCVNARAELLENLSDNVPPIEQDSISVSHVGSKEVASIEYDYQDTFHKIWFIGVGRYLILANYVCDSKDKSERPTIEDIIGSIEVGPSLSRN